MKRVLIANRGEIALRVVRACHDEGLEAVAVFSEPDRHSPHVYAADTAIEIGPAAAELSYLNIERLLGAARETKSDAVHPGYGFLAERAEFAEAVDSAGLTFIGPTANAIRVMGEKTTARRTMMDNDVPVVPGTAEPAADADVAARVAAEIGFPVLLKAVAGGGGKGMRRVDSDDDLRSSFRRASSEASKAFGNGDVYVEKLLERPRHVEIQILADRSGTTVHLGERECSIQRRHQKLIEEAPSPAVGPDLLARMGETAVRAARSVGYVGAGTIEFLLDSTGAFHFLEMNTRIQVEHPVTELVYGVDLVREQLRIARGDSITHLLAREPRGHAIECRITSEDPFDDFLPGTGTVRELRVPTGPGVRWDGGIAVGNEIGLHYDPLLGKLLAWGDTRDAAIARMQRALGELAIVGVATTQPFHRLVLQDAGFNEGSYDIGFLDAHGRNLLERGVSTERLDRVAVAMALAEHRRRFEVRSLRRDGTDSRGSEWARAARKEGLR